MISQVSMIRDKLVAKDERFEIYEMKNNSAVDDLIKSALWGDNKN